MPQRDLPFDEVEGLNEDLEDLLSIDLSNLNSVSVNGTDWTVGTIYDQIKKGNILLDPYFQRRDAWTAARKSQYVESLILGIPVPQVGLGEVPGSRGKFVVIDGKQRLLTIVQFFASLDPFDPRYSSLKLQKLPILWKINNETMQTLSLHSDGQALLSSFENQGIRTNIVRNIKNDDILYQIFLRLNTGSVKLSPQELRRALTPSPFWTLVDDVTENSPAMAEIFRGRIPDFRMRDVELLLRYMSFRLFLPTYSGQLKSFLDTTARYFALDWPQHEVDFHKLVSDFENATLTTLQIFQDAPFQKYRNGKYEGRFNRAVFDVMLYYFSNSTVAQKAVQFAGLVKSSFEELCEHDDQFISSIERTTKSKEATNYRMSTWANALTSATNYLVTPARVG